MDRLTPDLFTEIIEFLCFFPHHGGHVNNDDYQSYVLPLLLAYPRIYNPLKQTRAFMHIRGLAYEDYNELQYEIWRDGQDAAGYNYYTERRE